MIQATNAGRMRAHNRKLILNLIRLRPISRAEIAETTQLTRASVTMIVDELMENGLVEESCAEETVSMGRKRTQLAICHQTRFCFGVSISRRSCRVGVVDLYGHCLGEKEMTVEGRRAEDVLEDVCCAVSVLRKEHRLQAGKVLGMGVSVPGPVDYVKGALLAPPRFDAWKHVPLAQILEEGTGYQVLVEKDTNARVLEEKYFGAARELSDFMLVQLDDGVGSGVMIRDRLYRGSRGLGTEIGHTTVRFDGPPCSCGNRGCLENDLRIPALIEGTAFSGWKDLAEADETNPQAQKIIDRAAEYLSAALVNAINLYDLQQVIVSGEISSCPQPLLKRVNRMLSSRVLSRDSVTDPIVIATVEGLSTRTGAMPVLQDFFEERI